MHKLRTKLVIALAVSLSASLAFSGCTAGGGAATTADGKTVVTFWQQKFEDYQQAWFKSNVDKFNKSQDKITVDLQVVPADVWDQKMKAAQAAGKTPDVSTQSYGKVIPGVANGQFAQLDDLIPAEAWADLQPNVNDFVTVDGGHYAYPLLVEPSTVLFYRTDLFTAAGLDPASPPKDWASLTAAAEKLTVGDVKGMNIAQLAPDLGWSSWGLQYNVAGKLPISDDWSKADATNPAYADLFAFYKNLYQKGLMPAESTVGYADCAPFGEGKVAMTACGSWAIGQLKNDFPDMLPNVAVAAFPSKDGDATKPTSTLGGWTLAVDSKSKVQQASADFISYLVAGDPAIMVDFFKTSGFSKYPARVSVAEALKADPEASNDPFMAIVSDTVVPYSKAEPAYPWDVSLAFSTALEKAMRGGDITEALNEANAAIQSVIDKQKLAGTAPSK